LEQEHVWWGLDPFAFAYFHHYFLFTTVNKAAVA